MEALPGVVVDPTQYCDENLRLRHKVQKLYWMGLDREAEQLARAIEKLGHNGPTMIAPVMLDTD